MPHRGSHISSQTVSRWIVATVKLAYQLAKKPLPIGIKAHSMRALSTPAAFLRGVPLPDICKAATWATPSTFATHYRLDVRTKMVAAFDRAVLSSVLP